MVIYDKIIPTHQKVHNQQIAHIKNRKLLRVSGIVYRHLQGVSMVKDKCSLVYTALSRVNGKIQQQQQTITTSMNSVL
jgi:hypothetical protein